MVLVIQLYCRVPIRDNKGFLKDLSFHFHRVSLQGTGWISVLPECASSAPWYSSLAPCKPSGSQSDPPKWASMAPLDSLNVSMGNLNGSGAYKASGGTSTALWRVSRALFLASTSWLWNPRPPVSIIILCDSPVHIPYVLKSAGYCKHRWASRLRQVPVTSLLLQRQKESYLLHRCHYRRIKSCLGYIAALH
jgi:hypothetical protein